MLVGILYILDRIEVKNVIIGKQFENSENLNKFLKIVESKNLKLIITEIGDRVNIEKNLYIEILWPSSQNVITENNINNNSLVCKLVCNNFSILFTGDIEEIAENELIKLYSNTDKLKSNILKVAHHGSKSSSTLDFLKLVNPQIALIGVRRK